MTLDKYIVEIDIIQKENSDYLPEKLHYHGCFKWNH